MWKSLKKYSNKLHSKLTTNQQSTAFKSNKTRSEASTVLPSKGEIEIQEGRLAGERKKKKREGEGFSKNEEEFWVRMRSEDASVAFQLPRRFLLVDFSWSDALNEVK